jgi:hypothetical protein
VRLTDRCNASSFFLIGPTRQLKMMFKPIRLIATIIYLGALGMTLFVAIYVRLSQLIFWACVAHAVLTPFLCFHSRPSRPCSC